MTIVEALKRLCTAFGGTSNAKTIVPALKDCVTALGGESTAKTASQAISDVADAVEAGGGGGEAILAYIEVTHVLPNGKTLHHYSYDVFFEGHEDSINCNSTADLGFPFVFGKPTYIRLDSGESDNGDYMRAGSVSTTGDIEAEGESLTISGEGTVTITWVLA